VSSVVDLPLDHDEAPPESGVRVRLPRWVAPAYAAPVESTREVLVDVTQEVTLEVLDHLRALAPLAGPWMGLDLGKLGGAALTFLGWRCQGPISRRALRSRWPELVPGFAAMDRLAHLMVDRLCA
jgi:hypothetical protein